MARKPIHGDASDGKPTRLYSIWRGIRQRCVNPKATGYKDYGGRFITVSQEWDKYIDFKVWALENGYEENLTIERKDVNGNYNSTNCYWANTTIQACNKRKRENQTSKYIGVAPNRKGWRSYISYKGVRNHLGTYSTEYDAAVARDTFIKQNNLPHKLNF